MTSGVSAHATVIPVEVYDASGYATGKSVQVWIDYVMSVDHSYGEDADGNRGTTLVEYSILDSYLLPEDLKKVTAEEAARSIKEAEAVFEQTDKHF